LEQDLRDAYTVELYGDDPKKRDLLLKETPDIELKRTNLDAKITELDRALFTLSKLASQLGTLELAQEQQ